MPYSTMDYPVPNNTPAVRLYPGGQRVIDDMDYIAHVIQAYESFTQPYENASALVQVWLETLQKDFEEHYDHNPIHNITHRIKSLRSITEKLKRRGVPAGFDYAKDYLTDIAGFRVTCYYIQDVYVVIEELKKQPDAIIIKECDYIREPKENGYRSYHLILGVSLRQTGEYYPVEIQVRTLAMDFWASMEHQLVYKSDRNDKNELADELSNYADSLYDMETNLCRFYDGVELLDHSENEEGNASR